MDFLTPAQVLSIQQACWRAYGGQGGLRAPNALASALAQPRASWDAEFLHTPPAQAACYLFYINRHQPFYRHNQKTALLSALIFLRQNGYAFTASLQDMEKMARRLSKTSLAELTEFFSRHMSTP